jgi:hypothetical protein
MPQTWKNKATPPRIREVRLIFSGRAAYVKLSGAQGRIESATVYQEVADQLTEAGIRAFLLDIREASYPRHQVADIVARTEWLGRTYPKGRAALWHKGEDPYTVSQLVKALQRCGHQAAGIQRGMAARRFLIPREDADIWLIEDAPRRTATLR